MDAGLDVVGTCGTVAEGTFRPHPLMRGAHLQTILPSLFRNRPAITLRRERFELDDGDFVDLGWSGGDSGPIAILLHGLGGDLDSKYALGMALQLNRHGWRAAVLQFRGAGAEPNRLARCYHHGDTADFREVCRRLRAREPATPLFGIGWSLGANVLLKSLGEDGEDSLLTAAAASSPPFRLEPCVEHLRHGFARVYQRYLLTAVKAGIRRKHGPVPVPPGTNIEAALRARDFYELDDAYTAPVNGFRDSQDYYARAACGQYLHAVRRPALVIHALDDPFMVPAIVPEATSLSSCVRLELCRRGGHVGFRAGRAVDGTPWWLEQRFAQFLLAQRASAQPSMRAGSHMASP